MVTQAMHPIVAQLTPSKEQAPAVLTRDRNLAVTAGAGAGKTRTLVARYLSLLADGVDLRSIIAITFTKKAAREMRNRVREEIRRYLTHDTLSAAERRRWQGHYQELDAARIGTIHSLCAEILRRHPAAVGIDPRFNMLEEGNMALYQARAVEAALAWAADTPEVAPIFAAFGERELYPLIAAMLEQRLDIAAAIAALSDARSPGYAGRWAAWEPRLTAPIKSFLTDAGVQQDLAALRVLRADGSLARAEAAGDALVPDLRLALEHIDALLAGQANGDWPAVSRHLALLREHLKIKGRKSNWAPADPKAVIRSLRNSYATTLEDLVKKGIDLALDQRLANDIIPALLRVYENAAMRYDQAKQQLQALDFDDLEARALHLLLRHPDVRAYWQQEVAALLVDEFQDTNARQRDLLRALNGGGRRLFIVGDGKQSIYRFRGADVTVFREERRTIATEGLGLQLATSYRAHRQLVQGLNALLKPVLGVEEDVDRPYVEPFAPLHPYRGDPAPGLTAPFVELQLTVGSKSGGALDRAAQVLSARLAEMVNGDTIALEERDPVAGKHAQRPLNYGDIAILCRASTSFSTYENALETAGIPYLTIAGRGFYDRPEVRDLLNALTALADPTDDLALAGLLRSPAIGLSDMALYRLREYQQDVGDRTLWTSLQREDLVVLGDEAPRAYRAAELIRTLYSMVGRTPVADILKAFIDRTGYGAILLRHGERRAANNITKLLDDAQDSGIVSVDAFLAMVAELRDVAPREGEARALATGAVQIMSVHQAKGLEFPIVVIGDAARGSISPRGLLIDATFGIVPPYTEERVSWGADGSRQVEKVTSLAYRLTQTGEEAQEGAESDRLLYVAATRAQEMLLINGTISARKSGEIRLDGWLERLDGALHVTANAPVCDAQGSAVHTMTLDLEGQPAACTIYEPEAPLPNTAASIVPPAPLAIPEDLSLLSHIAGSHIDADAAVEDGVRDPPRRVWRVVPEEDQRWAPSWVVGNLVHLALKAWDFPDNGHHDFYLWAASEARNAGLTDEERIRNALQRAVRMLVRFQNSDLYAAMNSAAQRLTEVPYSVSTPDGQINTGVIDALWQSDGESGQEWHLVEFKTDRIQSESALEEVLQTSDYVDQVRRYVAAASRLLGQRPVPVLCFLNYAGRVRLVADRW